MSLQYIEPVNLSSSNIIHSFSHHVKYNNPYLCSLTYKTVSEKFFVVKTTSNTSSKDKIVLRITADKTKTSTLKIYDYSYELKELLNNQPWVTNFYQKSAQLNDIKSILPYYKEINKIIAQKKYKECNCLLRNINASDLSDILLVGLLRLTFSWKNELPAWSLLLENSEKELEKRNYDSKAVLRGLI